MSIGPEPLPQRAGLPRVVSLVPSATETLLAWGVVPVGVTRFCEHPSHPEIAVIGGTKDPDLDAIAQLRPDLVVMCREENLRPHAEVLLEAGIVVHDIAPKSVEDVEPELQALALSLGLDHLPVPYGPVPRPSPLGLRAFVPIWRHPWMTLASDTYGSSVLDAIGVVNVFRDHKKADDDAPMTDADRYPPVTLAEAAGRRPDIVLAPSEPYPFTHRHAEELSKVAPVIFVDGQDLFWWGARTPAAVARLDAEVVSAAARYIS